MPPKWKTYKITRGAEEEVEPRQSSPERAKQLAVQDASCRWGDLVKPEDFVWENPTPDLWVGTTPKPSQLRYEVRAEPIQAIEDRVQREDASPKQRNRKI